MIGLGLDLERTNQNLIDFFLSHTISNVSGKGWKNSSNKNSLSKKNFDPIYSNNKKKVFIKF